jgi:copper chaperone NosL
MRRLLGQVVALVLPTLLIACERRGTRPIAKGVDSCAHCRMTIDDLRLAAEAVRPNGNVLTFDSVQCLADYLAVPGADRAALTPFVARFDHPTEFLDATIARFTESPTLRGPMGGAAILAGTTSDGYEGRRTTWAAMRAQAGRPRSRAG